MVHQDVFLFLTDYILMCCSGHMPPSPLVILGPLELASSSRGDFGGQSCKKMSVNKGLRTHPQGLLHPLPIPKHPWSHISLDYVTGRPESQGNTVILVVVDRFSKACHLLSLPKLPTASQTAELLMQHVFRIHGFPQDIVSDRGSQFTSRFWKAFGSLIGSDISLSSGFHPQSNGQTERVNQEKTLRCLAADNQTTWSSRLVWAEFAHNTLYHSSLGMSPF